MSDANVPVVARDEISRLLADVKAALLSNAE